MLTKPSVISKATSDETTDSLIVKWTALPVQEKTANTAYSYEVNGDVKGETEQPTYTVKKIKDRKSYTFRVRGHNDCGIGEYSKMQTINVPFIPGKLAAIESKLNGSGIRFDWKAPAFSGALILKYKVEIKGKSGEFFAVN